MWSNRCSKTTLANLFHFNATTHFVLFSTVDINPWPSCALFMSFSFCNIFNGNANHLYGLLFTRKMWLFHSFASSVWFFWWIKSLVFLWKFGMKMNEWKTFWMINTVKMYHSDRCRFSMVVNWLIWSSRWIPRCEISQLNYCFNSSMRLLQFRYASKWYSGPNAAV